MIVTLTDSGYDVIFQPAHGMLAAKILRHWRFEERPRYWLDLLVASAQHDNNQRDFRGRANLTEVGAPKGFTVSSGESDLSDLDQPRETLKDTFFQGRYAALIVSMHFSTLYKPKRGESAELDTFLDEQKENQREWRRDLGLKKADAERDYQLLLWCDRCSLILCQGNVPQGGRKLEVQATPKEDKTFLFQSDDDTIAVEPWPFAEDDFEVSVEVHALSEPSYASDEDLLEALRKAKVRYQTWHFKKV